MQKVKRFIRLGILYITSVVLIGSPLTVTAFADDETYTYDPASGRWNTSKWVYDPNTGVYVPADAQQTPPPAPEQSTETSGDDSADSAAAEISNGGPSSNNTVNEDTNANSSTDINNGTKVGNTLDSDAQTGDAGVTQNSSAGDAQTGDANADATIVNSVHSTVGDGDTSGIARFTIDLNGDVNGDIYVGPAMGNAQVDKNTNINSDTNINNDDSITNDINLSAQSGDANVTSNTVAGSAQSGDANAVANLLNLVNTVIGANKSFIGTINIHGNLNGDILLSPEFIPQLLASNATVNKTSDLAMATNLNDDQTIVNNVDLNATSGTATVKDNTSAGSATTGDAQTDLQILNLTGHEVVAENSILVFVNVKGKWVGMILDAPGATAAAFGSGVVSDTVNATDTTNVNNKAAITNNLKLTAQSGDATVSGNTSGGNAATGNAHASANIANISSSIFKLSGWFAILFINIDGDFYGGVLQQTPAGDILGVTPVAAGSSGPSPNVGAPNISLGFKPNSNAAVQSVLNNQDPQDTDPNYAAAVLASAVKSSPPSSQQLIPLASPHQDPFSAIMMIGGFTTAGISSAWIGIRRRLEARAARKEKAEGLKIARK